MKLQVSKVNKKIEFGNQKEEDDYQALA